MNLGKKIKKESRSEIIHAQARIWEGILLLKLEYKTQKIFYIFFLDTKIYGIQMLIDSADNYKTTQSPNTNLLILLKQLSCFFFLIEI